MQTYIDKANGNGRTYLSKKEKHTTCQQVPNTLNFLGTTFKAYLRHCFSAESKAVEARSMYNV